MRSKKWTKKLLFLAVFISLTTTAAANSGYLYSRVAVAYRNISIFVDGRALSTPVEPFILMENGTTMVPLRVIGEALGKKITWDAASSRIYIGQAPAGQLPELPRNISKYLTKLKVLRNIGPFYQLQSQPSHIAGRAVYNSVVAELDTDKTAEMVVDLAGAYTSLDGFLGVGDDTANSTGSFTLTIIGDDRELYQSSTILPSYYPLSITLDTTGVNRLTMRATWQQGSQLGGYSKVTAVLGDFKFTGFGLSAQEPVLYTVKAGDTLYLIARNFNLSVEDIIKANPGINSQKILVGQEIHLPK